MAEEKHPRIVWNLHSVTGTNTIVGSTDHDYKAYRDRLEVRWRPTSFRNYFTGMIVTWVATGTNTGACTLNVNNRGAKDLKKNGSTEALIAGDIVTGNTYMAFYDGTLWQLLNQGSTDAGGGGGGTISWLRASADGTKVAGSADLDVSRTDIGTYQWTSDTEYASSGGYYQYGVVATPSTIAGNGGDGVSPFKALSDYDIADTGDYAAGSTPEAQIRYSPLDGNIYVPSSTEDRVFKHDLADFTGTVDQIDPGVTLYADGPQGVMDREGAYLWLTQLENNHLVAIKIADGSAIDFGDLTVSRFLPIGAATISGTYYVIAYEVFNGGTTLYTPNMGAGTLGTKTVLTGSQIASDYAREGCWDAQDNLWCVMNGAGTNNLLTQIDVAGGTYVQHDVPVSGYRPSSRMVYDVLRNEFYVGFTDGTTNNNFFYRAFGWIDGVADTIQWERLLSGISPDGVWHYTPLDILFIVKWNTTTTVGPRVVIRYHIPSRKIIDSNIINATYSLISDSCYYDDPYGYVIGRTAGGDNYLIRLDYSGAEIDVAGSGGTVSSVLHAMYEITSGTQGYIYLFRSLTPPIRADGEFTMHLSS